MQGQASTMEWTITLAAICAGLAVTIFAGWKSGRPKKDSLNARWISWPLVTVLAAAVLVLGLVHAINLMGVETGGRIGRGRP
jgi:hypothetical protein